MLSRIALSFLAVSALLPGNSSAQQTSFPAWAPRLDSAMRAELTRLDAPGIQVAVVERGRIVYEKSYGVADIETKRPLTNATIFHVGSVTKLVVSTLLAQLAADGVVDLHAPVSRHVTELAGRRAGEATTHQLLTHTAGWIDWGNPFGRTDDAALGEVLRTVGDTIVFAPAGLVTSYSNPGFAMAAYVAERAARRPFSTLIDSVLFRKMGMRGATFRAMEAMTFEHSQGHVGPPGAQPRVQRPMPMNSAEVGAGFMFANASSLARLAIALMDDGRLEGERVLSRDAVRLQTTGYVPVPGERFDRLGYGMHVDSVDGRRRWQKDGSMPGFTSVMTMWPAEKRAFVVNVNYNGTNAAHEITRTATPIIGVRLSAPEAVRTRDVTAAERSALAGKYTTAFRAKVEIADLGGVLYVRFPRDTVAAKISVDGTRLVLGPPRDARSGPMRVYSIFRDAGGNVRALSRAARAWVKEQ